MILGKESTVAFRHAKSASLSVGGTVIQAYLDSAALNVTQDTADTSAFGSTWKSSLPGLLGATISGSGFYDPTTSTGPMAVLWSAMTGGAAVACIYYPGGNTSGQRSYSCNAIIKNLSEPAQVGDVVKFSFDFEVTGAVTPATI